MIKNTTVQIEYVHRLSDDYELHSGVVLQAGVRVKSTSSPYKLESYPSFDGHGFTQIPPEKVQVYLVTTRTTVEEEPVDYERPKDGSKPIGF